MPGRGAPATEPRPEACGDDAGLEERGIPARRIFSLAASHGLTEQVERLEGSSVASLQSECKKRGLPFAALADKAELVACLAAVLVWERLPALELRRECKQWCARAIGPEPARGDGGQEDTVQRLVGWLWAALREARGIPSQRLGSEPAETVFQEVLRLEAAVPAALESEYKATLRRWDVPPEPRAARQYHLDCLTRILVLEELPASQLQRECQEYGLPGGRSGERHKLTQWLFVCAMCREPWEARGIPVQQLGPKLALKVAERHGLLEEMSDEELDAEHEALGPAQKAGPRLGREELLSRLKAAAVWREMPAQELLEECRRIGLDTEELEARRPSEPELRRRLAELLATGICLTPWEAARWEKRGIPVRRLADVEAANSVIRRVTQLEAMSEAALRAEYEKLGLPPEAGKVPEGREALLDRLRCAACWRELPLNELRRECQELRVSNGGLGGGMSDAEKRAELAERLIVARWADAWRERGDVPVGRLGNIQAVAEAMRQVACLEALGAEALAKECESTGLPPSAHSAPKDAKELLERLKLVVFWRAMPLDELREECMKCSVSFRMDDSRGRSAAEQQRELVERLVMATCADAWEARDIPVKRLSNIQAAVELAARWDRLEEMGSKDLQAEYRALGVPPEADAPKVLELLPRLKLASLWRSLPTGELQKECRKLGASAPGGDHQEMVQRLVAASWGASGGKLGADGDPAASKQKPALPADARELLQSTAKHFETLGLAANANLDDLKKAYHRLSLQHHPDKNRGAPQEEATRKFREVAEAYEALSDFMRQRN